jgi:hypothetical protein
MTPNAFGDLDLSRVMPLWAAIEVAESEIARADAVNSNPGTALTARRFDEAQPAGRRTYMTCHQLISAAPDHHHALRDLLQHGATMHAPWTLLRSTCDSGAWVNWILEPGDGIKRRQRGLRRVLLDFREQKLWQDVYTARSREAADEIATRRAEVTAVYRDEAAAVGVPWDQAGNKLSMVDELPKLAVVRDSLGAEAHLIKAFWRSMSGHTHGYGYALHTGSKVERSVTIPGGAQLTLTISDDDFITQAMMTGLLLLNAIRLYAARSTIR